MSKKLWGGRFKKSIDKEFELFSQSIQYDFKLARYDLYHSLIHVGALREEGILTVDEAAKLTCALMDILEDVETGKYRPDSKSEDIHSDIQNRMEKDIGILAAKLHTLRSRNDQIAFDVKWYCCDQAVLVMKTLEKVLTALQVWAQTNKNVCFPGYTHTQRAQVISIGDYVQAWQAMFIRDHQRLESFVGRLFICLGSGAIAGSLLSARAYEKSIKQFLIKMKLENSINIGPAANTLDHVSSRDFVLEFLSILAIIQVTLSRLAEDFILYASQEYDYFDLPEEFCTGSSLMPHKKNPDLLELIRGYTGRVQGNLTALLTTMKGLPLTYNRDMQLDKEPLFSSCGIVISELDLISRFIPNIALKQDKIAGALEDQNLYATEIAELLVTKGLTFKDAHYVVGNIIKYSQETNTKIKDMSNAVLQRFSMKLFVDDIKKVMNPAYAVAAKKSATKQMPRIRKK